MDTLQNPLRFDGINGGLPATATHRNLPLSGTIHTISIRYQATNLLNNLSSNQRNIIDQTLSKTTV